MVSSTALTSSDLIALSSGVVALCALGISAWQAYLSRRAAVLSARPILDIESMCTPSEGFAIWLRNRGLGPAIIESIYITTKNSRFELTTPDQFHEYMRQYIPSERASTTFMYRQLCSGSVIEHGERIELFSISKDEHRTAYIDHARELLLESSYLLTYKSIYGTRYVSRDPAVQSNNSFKPNPLRGSA